MSPLGHTTGDRLHSPFSDWAFLKASHPHCRMTMQKRASLTKIPYFQESLFRKLNLRNLKTRKVLCSLLEPILLESVLANDKVLTINLISSHLGYFAEMASQRRNISIFVSGCAVYRTV